MQLLLKTTVAHRWSDLSELWKPLPEEPTTFRVDATACSTYAYCTSFSTTTSPPEEDLLALTFLSQELLRSAQGLWWHQQREPRYCGPTLHVPVYAHVHVYMDGNPPRLVWLVRLSGQWIAAPNVNCSCSLYYCVYTLTLSAIDVSDIINRNHRLTRASQRDRINEFASYEQLTYTHLLHNRPVSQTSNDPIRARDAKTQNTQGCKIISPRNTYTRIPTLFQTRVCSATISSDFSDARNLLSRRAHPYPPNVARVAGTQSPPRLASRSPASTERTCDHYDIVCLFGVAEFKTCTR
ncbi:predicted protein [Plenodomus lingam JN3]|uniref:Predicted protein n=1 Tax=Leptosphaeria maculans (strain JN3 / isolate v23.1.3 / race Av1-4-5-6-7-8) TaxID=985895 RepID=E4ZM49_LEPMJ|nr:predicted protein [Plenodomus lingam JN3]CBX92398.1 predicted protein [Plenodomus lingam JN3]